MPPIDIAAIEQQARRLRAEEMQRVQGLMSERMRVYALLIAHTLLVALGATSNALRALFSWNPQAPDSRRTIAG
jgi:hypothetical protein